MLRRIIGVFMIAIALSGFVLSIAGLRLGYQLVDDVTGGIEETLQLTSQSLATVEETLLLTRGTVVQISNSISTTRQTAVDVARAVSDSQPMLEEVNQVISQDAAGSLEAVQTSLPNVVQVAANIDHTLRTLNDFQFERSILGIPLRFDLGIRYDPEEPFDLSLERIGDNLEGLPERLRSLEEHLDVAGENLARTGDNLYVLAADLDAINLSISGIQPLLDDYNRLAIETNDGIRQTRANLVEQMRVARLVITIIFVYIGLSQVAPLYLGLELLLRKV
jgi:ABC-type transporter Mla subunit MlaD